LPVWELARNGRVNVPSRADTDTAPPFQMSADHVYLSLVRLHSQNPFFLQMSPCALCNDQEKRDEDDVRLAFDFTPEELLQSARDGRCESCLVILEGLRQATPLGLSSFEDDVRRVSVRCRGQRRGRCDTLSLEVYFLDDRPRLELEYCSLDSFGGFCRFSAVTWFTLCGSPKLHRCVLMVRLFSLESNSSPNTC
jgi:hypothetical protein